MTKKIILVSALFGLFYFNSWGAETAKPRLTFIGHATVLIEGQEINLLTDPFWGNQILGKVKRLIPPAVKVSELPRIDLILISHTHPDHYDLQAIEEIGIKDKPIVIMPWGRGMQLKNLGYTVIELRAGQIYRQGKTTITAVTAKHMYGHCLGYLIEIDGKKIYFTGDTKFFSGLAQLKKEKIDLMMLPYDGYQIMGSVWTIGQALEAVKEVHPRLVIPIHWGTFNRWYTKKQAEPPEVFCNMIEKSAPEIRSLVLQPGENMDLDSLEHETSR
ncbi:MAG: MBL fold metallo-hydrolase [Elusimicrobiota bacterium]